MSHVRVSLLGLLMLVGSAAPALAQDSAQAPRMGPAEMRQRIETRFTERVKTDLGLTDEQTGKLKEVAAGWFDKRRAMEAEERDLRQALQGQLRPGVAANSDSVSGIVNQLLDLKVRYAESYREENKQLGFLTPVQRAQYYSLRERLLDALKQARQMRRSSGGAQHWQGSTPHGGGHQP
jgi:Spy/CpxP family protein refolding chaperone